MLQHISCMNLTSSGSTSNHPASCSSTRSRSSSKRTFDSDCDAGKAQCCRWTSKTIASADDTPPSNFRGPRTAGRDTSDELLIVVLFYTQCLNLHRSHFTHIHINVVRARYEGTDKRSLLRADSCILKM